MDESSFGAKDAIFLTAESFVVCYLYRQVTKSLFFVFSQFFFFQEFAYLQLESQVQ